MRVAACLAVGLALLTSAASALAEEPKASPEAIAAARAETDRLIAQAGGQGFFVNETADDRTLMPRHRASGMGCRFVKTQTNSIVLDAAGTAGEVATCRSYDARYKVTVTVSARRLEGEVKDAYKAFTAADIAAYPGFMLQPDLTRTMMDAKQRAILKRSFNRWSRKDGDLHRAGMIIIDGRWVLTLDATGPGDQVQTTEIVSDVVWLDAIIGALALAIDGDKTWTTGG
ncbi:hypothetical protein QO010_000101 [Caulobacter ginsengisoli]|uniref:Uncharacterized protein n=1 Tax=Caulobacter ginsengisoli TaxID=400775 RepID=A0ABU0IK19_9CAUL|nr:hypothetical protein [Caulobacter ginsengisoli]MDQ0462353.1 hypothetical protein [Caulobacter ginsengisoli]